MRLKKGRVFWYHFLIIVVYLIIVPSIIFLEPGVLNYKFVTTHFIYTSIIFLFSVLAFLFLFRKRLTKKIVLAKKQILLILLYATLIAFSEELIFLGILQGFFQDYFRAIIYVIILSSLIFGLVHLPNGAKGLHPKLWNWKFALLAFSAGLPLGLLFALTQSLLMPSILHTFFIVGLQIFKE